MYLKMQKKIPRKEDQRQKWKYLRAAPAGENVGDRGSLDRPVPAEGKAWLAVDVLRVSGVRAVVALVDGDLDLRSFGVGLLRIRTKQ